MIQAFSNLERALQENKPVGVFADTTILFSATYHVDHFNDESEKAFNILAAHDISAYVSVNARAEFLENHRRVFIADSLVDFLKDEEKNLSGPLILKLQSHKVSHRKKVAEGRDSRLDVNQIKSFRRTLVGFSSNNRNGWEILCQDYLKPQLTPIWRYALNQLDFNFISTRSQDRSPFLDELPSWERAVELMANYGIASADAMILNMFLCSKLPILLTADLEMAECATQESSGTKQIFVPDSLLNL